MKITVTHHTEDLKDNPREYYLLFRHIIGNFIGPLLSYLELYKLNNNEKYLNNFKIYAQENHPRFDEAINKVITIMEIEKVKGKLLILIKMLKKASNFDWTDTKKFKKFFVVFNKILTELKKSSNDPDLL